MSDLKAFFIFCLIVIAGAGFVTFYNNHDAWHGLVLGIYFYVLALYIVHKNNE